MPILSSPNCRILPEQMAEDPFPGIPPCWSRSQVWIEVQVGSWTQHLWEYLSARSVPAAVHPGLCLSPGAVWARIILLSLPLIADIQNISYKHPGASLSWGRGQEGSLCLASCLAAGGVVVKVSMKYILVLSGKWDLGVSTLLFLGGLLEDFGALPFHLS